MPRVDPLEPCSYNLDVKTGETVLHVVVNGNREELNPGTTLSALITRYKLLPRHIAIEVNQELVNRRLFEATTIKEGDQIEIVTLVGGGS